MLGRDRADRTLAALLRVPIPCALAEERMAIESRIATVTRVQRRAMSMAMTNGFPVAM